MSLFLSLETTLHSFSCALLDNDVLIAEKKVSEPQSTASQLVPSIEELFRQNGFKINQVTAVIVAAGPGSYTGLRIGTATAKGICYALNIPLISVNSLYLMAYQVISNGSFTFKEGDVLCPMLDARRMEVYCLTINKHLVTLSNTEAKVLNENSFNDLLTQSPVYFFGDGSVKFKSITTNPNANFIDNIHPLASFLGKLGFYKFQRNEFEDLETYEPFYLKDFVIAKPKLVS